MAIGRTFKEALFKGLRSLEASKPLRLETYRMMSCNESWRGLTRSASLTLLSLATRLVHRRDLPALARRPWFLDQLQEVMEIQKGIEGRSLDEITRSFCWNLKKWVFRIGDSLT